MQSGTTTYQFTNGPVVMGTSYFCYQLTLTDADAWAGPTQLKIARTDSPMFTGTPKAPTAAAGTSTVQLATTAFVQQEIAGKQDMNLGTANAGKFLVVGSDGNITAQTQHEEVIVSTAGAVTQALDAGKIYHFTGSLTALTITLNAAPSGQLAQYHFDFNCGSTAPTVTLPSAVILPENSSFEASKHYEVDILNNYGAVISWAIS